MGIPIIYFKEQLCFFLSRYYAPVPKFGVRFNCFSLSLKCISKTYNVRNFGGICKKYRMVVRRATMQVKVICRHEAWDSSPFFCTQKQVTCYRFLFIYFILIEQ